MKILLFLLFTLVVNAFAIPQLVNYQGQLTSPSGTPLDTVVAVSFRICTTPTGETADWAETHPAVTVTDGLFHVLLGSVSPLYDVFSSDHWLEVTVGSDGPMLPREQLVSVPHAYRVGSVDGASGGTITGKLSAGTSNSNVGDHAMVFGQNNHARGDFSVVGGGGGSIPQDSNSVTGQYAVIGGGHRNVASANSSTVGGGYDNEASGQNATVSGGTTGYATGSASTVGGGSSNYAGGIASVVGGGINNTAVADFSSTGGGDYNRASGIGSTISGGRKNTARGDYSSVGGGGGLAYVDSNSAMGYGSVVSGGSGNRTIGSWSTVCGGKSNAASWDYAGVGSGLSNTASGSCTYVGGGNENSAGPSSLAVVGGGFSNNASAEAATICGGYDNAASAEEAVVCGGIMNGAVGIVSAICGGRSNTAGDTAFVGGGYSNDASGDYAFVGGGYNNTASGVVAAVVSGTNNTASNAYATVGGGRSNTASGYASTIPGGRDNVCSGDYSFVCGNNAHVLSSCDSSFVFNDGTYAGNISGGGSRKFIAIASGGTIIYTNGAATLGAQLPANATAWVAVCDSTKKDRYGQVDTKYVLSKLACVPIETWSYKEDPNHIRHMGPMAQDFYAQFGLGESDTTISSLDPDGIALAAIQELAKENQKQQEMIDRLVAEIQSLRASNQQSSNIDRK